MCSSNILLPPQQHKGVRLS